MQRIERSEIVTSFMYKETTESRMRMSKKF